ncbi:HAD family hydrolase [filamentous cyanobacterium LEGE 11480]|uniref:HAD family hydrolase n=2 Tax=Romeriopsis TaxID=2992131 RepID=A0A928VW32_9CYAN|nr:HAD family hydrolase [Romeriopsis navalis LEGE 11480]
MDGTLTFSIHDFDGIKRELGLPMDQPILEALDQIPEPRASALHRQLDAIELEVARQSTQQAGAYELLSTLKSRGHQLGILTRNSKENAFETLAACDLADFFAPDLVLSRNCCAPKPSPDGINQLLNQWNGTPERSVMVGDYLFDLTAGRSAGSATVYIDPTGEFEWQAHADVSVTTLAQVTQMLMDGLPGEA